MTTVQKRRIERLMKRAEDKRGIALNAMGCVLEELEKMGLPKGYVIQIAPDGDIEFAIDTHGPLFEEDERYVYGTSTFTCGLSEIFEEVK